MNNAIELVEVKGGWFAICNGPRLAGFGPTPRDAQADLSAMLDVFWATLDAHAAEPDEQ